LRFEAQGALTSTFGRTLVGRAKLGHAPAYEREDLWLLDLADLVDAEELVPV
jgi:hypothetical protein